MLRPTGCGVWLWVPLYLQFSCANEKTASARRPQARHYKGGLAGSGTSTSSQLSYASNSWPDLLVKNICAPLNWHSGYSPTSRTYGAAQSPLQMGIVPLPQLRLSLTWLASHIMAHFAQWLTSHVSHFVHVSHLYVSHFSICLTSYMAPGRFGTNVTKM
eukprot:g44421.t1